jgi:hypothetical protein
VATLSVHLLFVSTDPAKPARSARSARTATTPMSAGGRRCSDGQYDDPDGRMSGPRMPLREQPTGCGAAWRRAFFGSMDRSDAVLVDQEPVDDPLPEDSRRVFARCKFARLMLARTPGSAVLTSAALITPPLVGSAPVRAPISGPGAGCVGFRMSSFVCRRSRCLPTTASMPVALWNLN